MTKRKKQLPSGILVTAWPEYCYGPGWSNPVIWCIMRDGTGKLSMHGLQNEQFNTELRTLFATHATAHRATISALQKLGMPIEG